MNLSPTTTAGPKLSSVTVPPELLIPPPTETGLFDGDDVLFNVTKTVPAEMFMLPATFNVPTEPTTVVASVPPFKFISPPTELTINVPLLTVVLPE